MHVVPWNIAKTGTPFRQHGIADIFLALKIETLDKIPPVLLPIRKFHGAQFLDVPAAFLNAVLARHPELRFRTVDSTMHQVLEACRRSGGE